MNKDNQYFKELELFLFLLLFESKFSLRICIKYSVIYYKQYLNPIKILCGI